jgi:AraC family transcriptional regulator
MTLSSSTYTLGASKNLIPRERLEEYHQFTLKSADERELSAFYTRNNRPAHGPLDIPARAGIYSVTISMGSFSTQKKYASGVNLGSCRLIPGSTHIYDAERGIQTQLHEPFETVSLLIPAGSVQGIRSDYKNASAITANYLHRDYDEVMHGLAIALVPALKRPQEAGTLFIEHIFAAMTAHLFNPISIQSLEPGVRLAMLAPWQVRRAKEMLVANLCSDVSLKELSEVCGLSLSYFARAFKNTVGVAPHRWLTEKRIENSKALMMSANNTLTEVALMSGFADQSHFTRIFSKVVGLSPGIWRRLHVSVRL